MSASAVNPLHSRLASQVSAAYGRVPHHDIPIADEELHIDGRLGIDLHRMHDAIQARNHARGLGGFTWDRWIEEILRDVAYGHGADPGAAADWLDREP